MLSFGPRGDDMEALCRAAGAAIIELDNHSNPLIAIEEIVKTNKGLFYVQSSSKSHAKIVKNLKSLNIPYVTQKTIALCVSQQAPLVADSDHAVIGAQVLTAEESPAVASAMKETQERTPRSRISSRLPSASIDEPAAVATMIEASQERTHRAGTASPLTVASIEEPTAIVTTTKENHELPRSRVASRPTPAVIEAAAMIASTTESTQQRASRSRTSSRLTQAPYDEPAPFDEPPILGRSQRDTPRKGSLVVKSQLRQTPQEIEHDDDDDDEDLPKEFSRSHRKSRRLISQGESTRSQRLQQSIPKDDAEESLPKTVPGSQGRSRRKETAGESDERKQLGSQTTGSQYDIEGGWSNRGESDSSQASRKRNVGTVGDDCDEEDTKPSKKAKRSLGGWTDVRKVTRGPELADGTKVPASGFDDDDEDLNPTVGDSSQPKVRAHFGARKALPKTNDGWLIAAPRERTDFKATEAEILDGLGDISELPPIAETDVVDGLVIRPKGQATRFNPNSSGIKDFRRFRKNYVKRAGELSRIQMRIVLPKASDKLMEIQEEQAALEASLREADILFQDSSGGIRGHFKPSSRLKVRQV